jgi:2-dehydro-3-deoxyphosphogluconate aldolase/(4S)-4-hydroxy-2-oxoglutarate aldolase|tara:strand:- start:543 stop:1190 length:648 start_codon:yes stop_codon:yes gene_type:complete
MRNKDEVIAKLIDPGIIAVVRAQSRAQVLPLSEALLAGGVHAIEITTTTPEAIEAIGETSQALGERALIGVGTVLDVETCHVACEAGAEFVVSPVTKPELVAATHEHNRPIMLGTYTPTEAQAAHEAGSDFVKLFPADGLGPRFIRNLRAPLPHLRIVPTGGVTVKNVGEFINAGSVALGIGSALVSKDILTNADWPELTRRAEQFVAAAKAARS